MNLDDISRSLNLSCPSNAVIRGLSIDSRSIQAGELFVAIRGENFDGHVFISEVASKGAAAVICEETLPNLNIPQLLVPSSVNALAAIARDYRRQFSMPVIAVTGSNGKTSVKEMIAAIFPQPSYATQGNLNNQLGAPLSVMNLQDFHRYAVFELGASHIGDIAHTVAIVQPQVALINNIAPAHIEKFGSIENVARAKGEIYQGLADGGTMVVNDDDHYAHFWDHLIGEHRKVLRFSKTKTADVYAKDLILLESGNAEFILVLGQEQALVQLKVPGIHHVSNALAAAACCHAVGIELDSIVAGLERFNGVLGRMTLYQGKQQATIIDDTYNANLRSTLTAIEVLAQRQGTRILVLGDMAELGEFADQHHAEVGLSARSKCLDAVLTYGKLSAKSSEAFGPGGEHYLSQEDLSKALIKRLDAQTTILVKGSRSAAMEHIVQQLI